MKTRAILSLSLSALMLGGTMVGCAAGGGGVASAGDRQATLAARQATDQANRAQAALARHHADQAVGYAEAAVTLAPRDAGYRQVLAVSYLKAGRFASAQTAFGDVLALTPDNGGAALNLALAQVGVGKWDDARHTLDAHLDTIPAADRGLAMALAGDPQGAVQVLTAAARVKGATAKVRQNLALALALSGRWEEAKAVVSVDLSPTEANQRLLDWAAFSHPRTASDQVAALLGVTPVADAGQPVALALVAPAGTAVAVVDAPAPPAPVVAAADVPALPEPVVAAAAAVTAQPVVAADPAPVARPAIRFVPHEVVQPLPVVPAAIVRPRIVKPIAPVFAAAVARQPVQVAAAPAKGDWYVQLGAYDNAAVAKDGWSRAMRRDGAFKGHTPAGMTVAVKGASYYRLSLGGFAHADASAMCRRYRAKGGNCFVRQGAGDQVAQWLGKGKPVQLASR